MSPRCTVVAVALALAVGAGGCGRTEGVAAPSTPAASAVETKPSAEAKTADAEAKTVAEAPTPGRADEAPVGLTASVKQEVDNARAMEALPEAKPPVVAPGDALLAVVGGVSIPQSDFDAIYALKIAKYAERGRDIPPSADRRYRRSITTRLIHHERLRQRVKELGVEADPTELLARQEQQRRGIRDWNKHLERRGETDPSLRAMLVAELREKAILEARGALEPTRAEVEADYDKIKGNWISSKPRVRASHILVAIPEAGPGDDPKALKATAKAEAQRIRGLVTAPGADFGALAMEHSTGPSAAKGGDIGIFTADRMAEEFSMAAFAMKPGQISEVVETKFGLHIILVVGAWPPGELPLSALEDQIRARLRQRSLHEGRRTLKEELAVAYPVVHHMLSAEEQAPAKRRARGEGDSPLE